MAPTALSAGQLAYQTQHAGDNKAPDTIAAQVVCLVLAYVGVGARFIARRLTQAAIGTDDYLMILALVFYTAAATDGFICIAFGAGKHEVTLTHPAAYEKASYAFIVLYRPAIAAVKFSVLFLYRRIFPQAGFRHILTIYGTFLLIYTLAFVVLDIFHCRPIQAAWSGDQAHCINMDLIWIIGGSLNAVTDIIALCLPLPLLWHLHVTLEKRIQLMGVFLLGGFVCVVSIIRVVELAGLSSSADSSYAYATNIIWSSVEVGVGIFCACLPVLRPIVNHFFPSHHGHSKASNNTYQRHSKSRSSNLHMKPWQKSPYIGTGSVNGNADGAGGEDHRPFAATAVETSVIRDSQPDITNPHFQQLHHADPAIDAIAVTTRIDQKVDDWPGDEYDRR